MSDIATNKPHVNDPFASLVAQVERDAALSGSEETDIDRLILRSLSAAILLALGLYDSGEASAAEPAVRLQQRLKVLAQRLPWLRPLDDKEHPAQLSAETAQLLLSPWAALDLDEHQVQGDATLRLLDDLFDSNLNRTYRLIIGQVVTQRAAVAYLMDHTLTPGLDTFAAQANDGTLRVLDPVCGSGAILASALKRIASALASETDHRPDALRRALAMLWGADVSHFAIELARLRMLIVFIQEGGAPDEADLARIGAQLQVMDTLLPWERLGDKDQPSAQTQILVTEQPDPGLRASNQRFLDQHFHIIVGDLPNASLRGPGEIYSVFWPESCPPPRKPVTKTGMAMLPWAQGRTWDMLQFDGREAPFLQRIFSLGAPGAFVGVISPESFFTHAYGKELVERVLSRWDLTQLLIPDVPIGTYSNPSILLFGRCSAPQSDRILAILSRGLRAEAMAPNAVSSTVPSSFFTDLLAKKDDGRLLVTHIRRRDLLHHPWDLAALLHYPVESLQVQGFKSLTDVTIPLGRLNVFIGANGAGKSNLLEAVGLLGSAAFGRVDLESLARRGVRPGLPRLYASAFGEGTEPEIVLSAQAQGDSYRVALRAGPLPGEWSYAEELLAHQGALVAQRSPTALALADALREPIDKRRAGRDPIDLRPGEGISQLMRLLRKETGTLSALLDTLESFAIYTPFTPMLRGTTPDPSQLAPLGLSGGRLGEAVQTVLEDAVLRPIFLQALRNLIDWSDDVRVGSAEEAGLSPGVATTRSVLRFHDRYMKGGPEWLSGFDASEGALYVAFLLALVLHPSAPRILAVDNADQSLNPRLARALIDQIQTLLLEDELLPQVLMTVHNPPVLDSLDLQDDRVRLFVVSRLTNGPTSVRRIEYNEALRQAQQANMTLSELWVTGMLGGLPNI